MASARNLTIQVEITYSWWLIPYLQSVLLFARITGLSPDMDKVNSYVGRAVRLKIITATVELESH